MLRKIVEMVRFHRGARAAVASLREGILKEEAVTQTWIGKLSAERQAHRKTKADLRAMRERIQTAEERAFWFEAENRDLRVKLGLAPKTLPKA